MKTSPLTTRRFWRAAAHRAVRTTAQTAVALIGTAALIAEVAWTTVGSGAALAGILSVLTSIAAIPPEADDSHA
ncbi:MAG: holin [Acidimicrobiales bacterium]